MRVRKGGGERGREEGREKRTKGGKERWEGDKEGERVGRARDADA